MRPTGTTGIRKRPYGVKRPSGDPEWDLLAAIYSATFIRAASGDHQARAVLRAFFDESTLDWLRRAGCIQWQ